jgi:uncharacterized membrane protein
MYRVRTHASNITALRPGHAKSKRLLIRSTALNMSNAADLLGARSCLTNWSIIMYDHETQGLQIVLDAWTNIGRLQGAILCGMVMVHLVATAKYAVIYLRMA